MSVRMRCMHRTEWGFCATPVTAEQFVDGGCGGIHGHDGYITQKQLDQELRERGLAELVDRLAEFGQEGDE